MLGLNSVGALNTAVRSIARAFTPSEATIAHRNPNVLNQSEGDNSNNQPSVTWPSDLISGQMPDVGSDYVGSRLLIVNGVYTVPAAVRCVDVKTNITARLPVNVVTSGDFPTKVENHWVNFLFNNLNPNMDNVTFKQYVYSKVYAEGEQYLIIEKNDRGFVTSLTPAKFQGYDFSGIDNNPYLQLQVPDVFMTSFGLSSTRIQNRKVLLSDTIHLTDGTYDPFRGRAIRPMLQKGRNPVGLYLAVLKRYEASLFLGGHARNYLQTSMTQWKEFESMLKTEGFRGIFGASKTVPIPFGSQLIEAGKSHVESQTLEMLQFLIGEIARAWGVPLFMLYSDVQSGSSGKASRPDLAEQFINFVRSGYGTEAKSFEAEFNRKLLGPTVTDVRIDFDLDSLTSGTMQQKAALAREMVAAGIWTVNEGRNYTNRDSIEGGDVLRAPTGSSGDNKPIGDNQNAENNNVENEFNPFKYSRFNETNVMPTFINSM